MVEKPIIATMSRLAWSREQRKQQNDQREAENTLLSRHVQTWIRGPAYNSQYVQWGVISLNYRTILWGSRGGAHDAIGHGPKNY